jgi:DNA-binding XRE family transcriptional regulator
MTDLAKLKVHLLEDPDTREEYEAKAPEFAVAHELIAVRTRAGLSQAEIAEQMGTSQSTVARLASGQTLPSMRTPGRYASATRSRAMVKTVAQPRKRLGQSRLPPRLRWSTALFVAPRPTARKLGHPFPAGATPAPRVREGVAL